MGRTELEMAFRDAGVGGDLAIALAADMDEPSNDDNNVADDGGRVAGRLRRGARLTPVPDPEALWGTPTLVADADVCGGFGDLCGRRVA